MIEKMIEKIKSFFRRHESYFSTIWGISLFLGFVFAFIKWLSLIFESIQAGSFLLFAITIIFQSIIIMVQGFLSAVVIAVSLIFITFVPYLIIRGLLK